MPRATLFVSSSCPWHARLTPRTSHRCAKRPALRHLRTRPPACTHVAPRPTGAPPPSTRDDPAAPPADDIRRQSLSLLEWPQITEHVLRHAATPQGRRALSTDHGLYIPATRPESEHLLQQTREVYALEYVLCKPLSFAGVRDVSSHVRLAAKGRILTGRQLVDVAETLFAARRIRRHIDAASDGPVTLAVLPELVSSFRTWPDAEAQITRNLDEYGDVQDTADPQLRGIRRSLRDTISEIRSNLNDIMARHSAAVQERVIMSRYDRFVIPVKASHKAVFRRGIVHDASSTGSTAYIEPASVRSLNDRARELAAKEKARVNAILTKLSTDAVAPIAEDVVNLSNVLGTIDAAAARARCSRSLHAVDVVFDDDRPLRLLGVRHPLLTWQAMAESSADETSPTDRRTHSEVLEFSLPAEPEWKRRVVPSSYVLNEDVRCVCVTGPNTGGKTLSLKTIGVSVLMAKAGLFVPATIPPTTPEAEHGLRAAEQNDGVEVARIPYFDAVLADIGDDQSLVQSLSTFSGHVRRIKRILAASTPKSLVLLDEIGSGTDPAEGAALGMAILRDLAVNKRAALTFATTHHGELKTLKYAKDDSARFFENASVEFDDVRMAPTFKLVWGIPGRSNALAIAERLGMKTEIVEEARFLLSGSSDTDGDARVDIEKMISSLERDKNAAEQAREQSERALREVEGMKRELQDRLERLRESEVALRQEQRVAMEGEIKDAKRQIARVIKEMQLGGGSAQAASRASDKLNTMILRGSTPRSKSMTSESQQSVATSDQLEVGDRINVPRLGVNEVKVVELVSAKEVLVTIGTMKAKVKVKEIASVRRHADMDSDTTIFRSQRKERVDKKQLAVRTAANTIDIRGERVDSAEAKVDQALDKALAMGTLWIIHGYGTGRLRNGIRNFLSQHHLVERIEDATQSDGGTGVTIAYLS